MRRSASHSTGFSALWVLSRVSGYPVLERCEGGANQTVDWPVSTRSAMFVPEIVRRLGSRAKADTYLVKRLGATLNYGMPRDSPSR